MWHFDSLNVDAMEAEMLGYGIPAANAVKNGTFKLAKLVLDVNSRTPTDELRCVTQALTIISNLGTRSAPLTYLHVTDCIYYTQPCFL